MDLRETSIPAVAACSEGRQVVNARFIENSSRDLTHPLESEDDWGDVLDDRSAARSALVCQPAIASALADFNLTAVSFVQLIPCCQVRERGCPK